jgi:hypothetical protein
MHARQGKPAVGQNRSLLREWGRRRLGFLLYCCKFAGVQLLSLRKRRENNAWFSKLAKFAPAPQL